MALRNLGIEHEVVAIAEIDKYAIKSYAAIHGETYNVGDISKVVPNEIPDHDLFTYSFPCQDISVAGKQAGLDKDGGTRSGLLWECEKIIAAKKPKYLLLENVKNLVGKKHKPNFDVWLEWLESQGYSNYWKVLNAKDYGIPQNRERVFVVSILDDVKFEFESEKELDKSMVDLLDKEVDDKYYLSDKMVRYVLDLNNKQKGTKWEGRAESAILNQKIASTIACRTAGGGQRAGVSNYVVDDGGEEISVKELKLQFEFELPLRIRKLTPLECWRLMGFSDEDFYKAEQVCSNTQLYKQAGNSIVVNVLESIFRQMFKGDYK